MASIRRYRSYLEYCLGQVKYLFIHIPKNAGVAVKRMPSLQGKLVATEPWFYHNRDYVRRLQKTMKTNGEHHGFHHARLRDIHPKVRSRLQPFAIIRNPWSRVVSRYQFAQLAITNGQVSSEYAPNSFEEFLDERFRYGGKEFYWHRAIRGWFPQRDYIVDENGEISAHLLRQENLSAEIKQYFQLNQEVPRRNISGKNLKPYKAYYTQKSLQIVADWYADDIDTFGFSFDSPATKNCWCEESSNCSNSQRAV